MKTKIRGLTLSAVLLSASNIAFADENSPTLLGEPSSYGEEAYFAEEATYDPAAQIAPAKHAPAASGQPAPAKQYVGSDSLYVSDEDQFFADEPSRALSTIPRYAPIGISELRQVGHAGHASTSCDSGTCDGACDSGCSSRKRLRGRLGRLLDRADECTWGSWELLLWFPQDRDMPALITTSDPGTSPALPEQGAANVNNVAVVFGDDIEGELSGGYRSDFGRFLTENLGIGGRYWILAENNDSYFNSSNGAAATLGRPFFNVNRPVPPNPTTFGEDALLIASNFGGAGNLGFTGTVAAESSLDLEAFEGYARMRIGRSRDHRFDFIAGYSHFEIDDLLWIQSTTIENATLASSTFTDLFDTENEFNGGQLGFEITLDRGPWSFKSLTKVHLGNMEQAVNISGLRVDQPAAGAPTVTAGGVFAQNNQGTFQRDVFAFISEANLKVGYRVRENLSLSVGYSFIYFDNVALNGDIVDRVVDGTSLTTGVFSTRPAFDFEDSSLWVQGIDLGMVLNF